MKKTYLLLMAVAATSFGFAQNTMSQDEYKRMSNPSAEDVIMIQQAKDAKAAYAAGNRTQNNKGGIIDKQRVDYGQALLDNPTLGSFFTFGRTALLPDSSTFIVYSNDLDNATTHGIGMIYDPQEDMFGTATFSANDVVTVDSLVVDGLYMIRDKTDLNDSLIFTVYIGDPSAGAPPFYTFNNVEKTFTLLNFDILNNYTIFDYTGSAADGQHAGLTGTATKRFAFHLTEADSGSFKNFAYETPGLTIPAGQAMGVFIEYQPTPGGWAPGDSINLPDYDAARSDFNLFRPYLYYTDFDNDKTFWNLQALQDVGDGTISRQHNSVRLGNKARYNAAGENTADIGGNLANFSAATFSIYAVVSGTSTLGITEESISNVEVSVYPNPSNGVFNIKLNTTATEM
jgi:hypothetical protein